MFIDEAKIWVKAGDGGNGCVAFRREKFVPRGGPSGGNGGRGGHVIVRANQAHNTLIHFRFHPEHKAERGRHGEGSKRTGRDGGDLILAVPRGTVVIDSDTSERIADFKVFDQELIVAHGGRGGRGNTCFATSTNQAPRQHEDGFPGAERHLLLELKLLADVGLVGFPNAGKSTLISKISSAHPKIANYPFTTREPHLGVVLVDEYQSYVVADIPGLIEGAHKGHGLGTRFLRHIERTHVLLHMIDVSDFSGRNPIHDYTIIFNELAGFSPELTNKPMIVAATKIDAAQNQQRRADLESFCKKRGLPFFAISAVTGEGIDKLKYYLCARVREGQTVAELQ